MTRSFHNVHEDHTVPVTTGEHTDDPDAERARRARIRKASLTLAGKARGTTRAARNRAELEHWLDMLGLPPFDGRSVRLRDRYLYGKGRTSS